MLTPLSPSHLEAAWSCGKNTHVRVQIPSPTTCCDTSGSYFLPLSMVIAISYPNHTHREDWTPLEYLIIFEDQTQRGRIDSKVMILSAGLNFSKSSVTQLKTSAYRVGVKSWLFTYVFNGELALNDLLFSMAEIHLDSLGGPLLIHGDLEYCTCLIPTHYLIEWNGRMCFSKCLRWLWKQPWRVNTLKSTIYISLWT